MRNEASRPFGLGEDRPHGGCARPRADSILAFLQQAEAGAHLASSAPYTEGDSGTREGTNGDIHPDKGENDGRDTV
jgi:hypothetical protein